MIDITLDNIVVLFLFLFIDQRVRVKFDFWKMKKELDLVLKKLFK